MRQISIAFLAVATVGICLTSETLAVRRHLVGAQPCTWGPAYWCSNITTSSQCSGTEFCIERTWPQMQVEADDGAVCGTCKNAVTRARGELGSSPTEQDLETLFTGSCASINVEPVVNECKTLVSQNYTELAKILASPIDAPVVCSVAGLCNSPRLNHLMEQHSASARKKRSTDNLKFGVDELGSDECSKCNGIVNYMRNDFDAKSRDDVLDGMINVCQSLSSFSDACASIVIEYFSTIYSHVQENFEAKNICHLTGQCSGKFHKHEESGEDLQVEIRPLSNVGKLGVGDDLPCKLCEQLVGHLRDLLIANTTENEFQQVLDGLCGRTKSFAPECKSIVDQYYPEIYNYLVNGLDKNGICEMAGICPAPNENNWERPISVLLPEKTFVIGVELTKNRMNSEKIEDDDKTWKKDEVEDKPSCPLCLLAVGQLYNAIKDNKTEANIEHALQKLCTHLPKSLDKECLELVHTYSEELIETLMNDLTPQDICVRIKLCDSNANSGPKNLTPLDDFAGPKKTQKPKKAPKTGSTECTVCEFIMQTLDDAMSKDYNRNKIKKIVYNVCYLMPKTVFQKCNGFVDQYADVVIELLSQDISPLELCTFLKVCQANLQRLHDSVNECAMCQSITSKMFNGLGNSTVDDDIELVASKVCWDLPGPKHDHCLEMMKTYERSFINLFRQREDTAKMCTKMAMCDAGDFYVMKRGRQHWMMG